MTNATRGVFSGMGLKTLDVDGPVDLWDVPTLTYVNVCKNKLEELPVQLALLPKLLQLHVAGNKLTVINRINDYPKLAVLTASQNLLSDFPRGVGGCPNLQLLDLSMNSITEIPTNIRYSQTLRALWLTDNKLTVVPDCLIELSSLEVLALRNNQIEMLPDNLGESPKLRHLYVDDNYLRVLPPSLKNSNVVKGEGILTCVNNFFCPAVEEALLLAHGGQGNAALTNLFENNRYNEFYKEFSARPPPLEDGMRKAAEKRLLNGARKGPRL